MTRSPDSPERDAARAAREKRLAEALRANLRRRKAAAAPSRKGETNEGVSDGDQSSDGRPGKP
jgi:hypothetical protein